MGGFGLFLRKAAVFPAYPNHQRHHGRQQRNHPCKLGEEQGQQRLEIELPVAEVAEDVRRKPLGHVGEIAYVYKTGEQGDAVGRHVINVAAGQPSFLLEKGERQQGDKQPGQVKVSDCGKVEAYACQKMQ